MDRTKFSYWTQLSENIEEGKSWIHALPIGEYKHPVFGDLNLTVDRIKRFAESVNNKVRGIDPDIDYDHKAKTDKAAGWVKSAEVRPNGLWLLVEWTKGAIEAIKNGEYRYFSSEYVSEWEDAKGNKFSDVLLGGGLTNRPFIKDLEPINLSEILELTEGKKVDRTTLIQLLGLEEDATDEAITAKIKTLSGNTVVDLSKLSFEEKDGKLVIGYEGAEGTVERDLPKAEPAKEEPASAEDKELAQLAENSPAVKELLERMEKMELAERLSTTSVKLSEVGKDKNLKLPPVVLNELRDVAVTLSDSAATKLYNAITKLAEVGFVDLAEKTGRGSKKHVDADESPITQLNDAVEDYIKQNDKATYSQAMEAVQLSDPELYSRYRTAIRNSKSTEVA